MSRAVSTDPDSDLTGRERIVLGVLALLALLPVTMPVPVLRGLVQERFDVSDLLTSLFMSINMVGAVVAAPIAGAWADRFGRRNVLISVAFAADAVCFWGMTLDVSFPVFMAIRFVEGCCHILALSLLLSLAADRSTASGRGRTMGVVGAALTFGVAMGAPLGGALGREDPVMPLRVGAAVLAFTALLAAFALRDGARTSTRQSIRDILATVLRDRTLAVPLAFAFVDRFTVGFFTTTFSLYMKRVFSLEPAQIGALLGAFLVPFSLLSYFSGRLSSRFSRSALVAGGSLSYGALVMTVGLWEADQLVPVMLGLGVLSAVMFVPNLLMVSDLSSAASRSTAMAGFNAAGSLGFILGPLTGGLVSQSVADVAGWETGYAAAFAVAGFAELVCVLATLPMLRALVKQGRVT